MKRTDQKRIVRELCQTIERETREAIEAGKIPPEWDGHELRALLARKFEAATLRTLARGGALEPRSARRREFERVVIVANL